MNKGFFVTGTDTHVGKTFVSVLLMRVLGASGLRVGGMKPVASGGNWVDGDWRNEDALSLRASASLELPYESVNPYAFRQPVSPHLAARQEQREVCLETVLANFREIQSKVDCVVVEGAGGWLCPLGQSLDIADLAQAMGLPVILVVGIRLGCINHARLTDRAIRESGLPYAGWVANFIDPEFTAGEETTETLEELIGQNCIGKISYGTEFQRSDFDHNNHWNRSEILRRVLP